MKGIINSLLDTDLYKASMQWAVIQKFPNTKVRYTFINRNKTTFPDEFAPAFHAQLKHLSTIRLTSDEERFLRKIQYIPQLYIDFLKGYKFNIDEVSFYIKDNQLYLTVEGLWYTTILWEVVLLAIISELYYELSGEKQNAIYSLNKTIIKADYLLENNIKFSDFGTRRRFSKSNHEEVVSIFSRDKYKPVFMGTSNMNFANQYNIKSIGTVAHEWFMVHGALYGYKLANEIALENWVDVYQGDLGIALSDTYTTDIFFKQFNKKFAKLFDGVRQDSGDPYKFADKTIHHYKSLGIDPMSKTIVFSDSLDVFKAKKLMDYCEGKIKCSFGIGTNFTNDVGVKPLNIVIKASEVYNHDRWVSTVKLSDDEGKHTGTTEEINYCKYALGI